HSIAYDGNLEYSYKNSKFILNSHIAKRDFSLETKAKLTYKMLYSELGVKYDYPNKVYPVIGVGFKEKFDKVTVDVFFTHKELKKFLFNINLRLF
uniref:hypothetical protein n=1 Tax=Oceanivirga salmonicida TaxID=1769291 RepID=UPI0018D233B1